MNYQKYATLLCDYCLALEEGHRLLVRSSHLATPLLQEVYALALERGATVDFLTSFERQDRIFYDHSSDDGLGHLSTLYKEAVSSFDAILSIMAPFDLKSLNGVPSSKKAIQQASLAPIKKKFMERSANGDLRWSLCVFPTEAGANECGMSLAEYTDFVAQACGLNNDDPVSKWLALRQYQQVLVDRLNTGSTIRFIGPGTDISFSIKGRKWMNSDGQRNMPSGEVFTSPVEDSGNGVVRFSYPTVYQGIDVEGIELTVKNGYVESWSALKGQEALDDAFAQDGARFFGEIAIGTNEDIQQATKNILFDEKIGGSIHMAIGASYPETGGKNESSVHWDMITDMKDGGSIELDGTTIYENGYFI